MHSLKLFLALIFLVSCGALAAPTRSKPSQNPVYSSERTSSIASRSDSQDSNNDAQHNLGDFVGVRPPAYEARKPRKDEKAPIHPAVVVDGPHPETGKYSLAIISNNLPKDPPQEPIQHFHHPDSNVRGNVALSPPKVVAGKDIRPWKDDKTGKIERPMSASNLARLKNAMIPHADWEEPKTPTPPPTPKLPPVPKKNSKGAPRVNAHASSSRIPAAPSTNQHPQQHPISVAHSPTGPGHHPYGHPKPLTRSSTYPNPPKNIRYPAAQHPHGFNPVQRRPTYHPGHPTDPHPGSTSHPANLHSGTSSTAPPATHAAAGHPGEHPVTAVGGHPAGHPVSHPSGSRPPSHPRGGASSRRPTGGPRDRPSNVDNWRSRKDPKGKRPADGSHEPDSSRKPPPVRRSLPYVERSIRSQ